MDIRSFDLTPLAEAAGWAEDLEPLFRYFRREWLPRVNELSVFSQEERTNNCSESDNRSIATAIPQNRLNISTLIGKFISMESEIQGLFEYMPSGFIQLEHISWSDKMAVECGNVVHGPPRWKTLANDKKVKRLSELLVKDQIRPGRFLELISWVNQGALNHGMKLDVDSASDSDDE
ncbi:Malformin synthetase mlfA [Frankliniella fusca]|uniref:Malformin synthetase mlfA n=1 Tax=Frankliniella fusca TaxID=407009 RepID=A0AAE1LFS8_9NEOP|nr:Malformin synthetase mlfA [Frankliniella fusca]